MLMEAYEGFEWVLWLLAIGNIFVAHLGKKDSDMIDPYICLIMSYLLVILTITDTLKG